MAILSHVGRTSLGQRCIRVGLYTLLSIGALAIIFPMLIVLGQTLSDSFDLRDNAIVPYYLRDRNELALKHIYAMSQWPGLAAARHRRNLWKNQAAMRADLEFYESRPDVFAAQGLNLDAWETVLADFHTFKATLPASEFLVKRFRVEDYLRPFLFERFGTKASRLHEQIKATGNEPDWLVRLFPEEGERANVIGNRDELGLAIMNHELQSDYRTYYGLEIAREGNFLAPFWRPGNEPKAQLWVAFKESLPPEQRLVVPSEAYWHLFLKLKYRNIEAINAAWGTKHQGIPELEFSQTRPDAAKQRADWDEFVVHRWPRRLIHIPQAYAGAWRTHVRRQLLKKHQERPDPSIRALQEASRLSGQPVATWDELALPSELPADEALARYWSEFTVSGTIPAEAMTLNTPEHRFRQFLKQKYDSVARLNDAWQTTYSQFEAIPLPVGLADYAPVRYTPWSVRWRFITESYVRVAEYLFGRGRAAVNTLILVALSLIFALTINPMAAYSLSRFPMKHSTKILIFFLATMAFPAEVAMIPNFLLLRDLGLLNTFAALVLPRMANGFAIFLLKGFFDSLPQELYHAAEIDGASEIQIFRYVAVPLITPILAFIGLSTFVVAYSSFMWAFVICPNEQMWTLMVWVYDFQTRNAGNNYVMAATVLVCIPPLIVFFFANRIIMKGIIIPSMK